MPFSSAVIASSNGAARRQRAAPEARERDLAREQFDRDSRAPASSRRSSDVTASAASRSPCSTASSARARGVVLRERHVDRGERARLHVVEFRGRDGALGDRAPNRRVRVVEQRHGQIEPERDLVIRLIEQIARRERESGYCDATAARSSCSATSYSSSARRTSSRFTSARSRAASHVGVGDRRHAGERRQLGLRGRELARRDADRRRERRGRRRERRGVDARGGSRSRSTPARPRAAPTSWRRHAASRVSTQSRYSCASRASSSSSATDACRERDVEQRGAHFGASAPERLAELPLEPRARPRAPSRGGCRACRRARTSSRARRRCTHGSGPPLDHLLVRRLARSDSGAGPRRPSSRARRRPRRARPRRRCAASTPRA